MDIKIKTDTPKSPFKMKFDSLERQTKYYLLQDYGCIIEVELNRDHWWFVQLDASIRTVFGKYGQSFPKFVVIDEQNGYTDINVFHYDLDTTITAISWMESRDDIQSELDELAHFNSLGGDDDITYHFYIY